MIAILWILALPNKQIFAQQAIAVHAQNQPLNKVITNLRDYYKIKLSFNDDKLALYKVNVNANFNNAEEALKFLLKDLPLTVELVNDVFIISSKKVNHSTQKLLLIGQVSDAESGESLPFSNILINNYPLTTDLKGNFSYSSTDSVFRLQVSYLGYYKLDTLVQANSNLKIALRQSTFVMPEIVLTSTQTEIATLTNTSSGNIRVNQNVGEDLPGSSDNSVYNFLRLQPGILASGEQANDLIIWGSYRGHTKVSFDGFTIFGVKNFNDNIGAVNPLMTKDLNIKKGGYGVEQGDRVGGIVDITGIEGSVLKPSLKIGLNNLTLNAEASTPLFKNTALVIAGRQTYFNLYNSYSVSPPRNNRSGLRDVVDLNITPDYVFKDVNLKFSGKSIKGDSYFISLFSGADELNSSYNTTQRNLNLNGSKDEENQQYGASAFYNKVWRNGTISSLTIASSGLNNAEAKSTSLTQQNNGAFVSGTDQQFGNEITEQSVKFTHQLPVTTTKSHLLGFGYIENRSILSYDDVNPSQTNRTHDNKRWYAFSEHTLYLSQKFKVVPGLRTDYDATQREWYFQPRLSTTYRFNPHFKMTASWGLYHQFIAYNGVVDTEGNFRYQWTVSDGNTVPVYHAQHWVAGAAYEKNKFFFNVDVYHKTTDNITRFVQNAQGRRTLIGNGRSTGIDFLIKKEFNKHSAWVAYSLSNTEERFPRRVLNNIIIYNYERAPQDQTHEFKFAGLFNIYKFYLSANYVYGSGFKSLSLNNTGEDDVPYNRFDTAITYKFKARKYNLDAGVSLINVFNTQNLRAGNLDRISTGQLNTINIYANTVPFTPTIFLKLAL